MKLINHLYVMFVVCFCGLLNRSSEMLLEVTRRGGCLKQEKPVYFFFRTHDFNSNNEVSMPSMPSKFPIYIQRPTRTVGYCFSVEIKGSKSSRINP